MNRSVSPVLRPLSNISNRKPTTIENQKKETIRKLEVKSTVREQPPIEEPARPKSCITTYEFIEQSSKKSSVIRKRNHVNQESKFFFFKIIVFLGVVATILAGYQLQMHFFGETSSKQGVSGGQLAKERMIANSVSSSIINQVVFEHKAVNIALEKEDVKRFYSEDYTSNLWRKVLENLSNDARIRVEKKDDVEFWTL